MSKKPKSKIISIGNYLADYLRITHLSESLRLWDQPNAVFIWVPKTAGTSLRHVLGAPKFKNLHDVRYRFVNKGTVTFGHMDYSQLVKKGYISSSFDKSAYKFGFVRNPYSRAVSLFYYLKRAKKLSADISFLSFCRNLLEKGCEPIGLYNVRGLSQCNPQSKWIENAGMNYIGKVESIDIDFLTGTKILGIENKSIPQANATAHPDYQDCYCSESKAIIEDFYKDDFFAFGYEYEEFLGEKTAPLNKQLVCDAVSGHGRFGSRDDDTARSLHSAITQPGRLGEVPG